MGPSSATAPPGVDVSSAIARWLPPRPPPSEFVGPIPSARGPEPSVTADDKRHTGLYPGDVNPFRWNAEKNLLLDESRGITFERIVVAIGDDGLRDVLEHPNQKRYPGQQILVVACDYYAYLVPFVESDDHRFLKTIIPSRKATRDYLRRHEQTEGEHA